MSRGDELRGPQQAGQTLELAAPQQFEAVLARARELRSLTIEGDEILHSDDQATRDALVCIDKWLGVRDGAIRMQLRVLARPDADAPWECVEEGRFGAPLSQLQALSLVAHWACLDQEALARLRQTDLDERDRGEACLPPRPRCG